MLGTKKLVATQFLFMIMVVNCAFVFGQMTDAPLTVNATKPVPTFNKTELDVKMGSSPLVTFFQSTNRCMGGTLCCVFQRGFGCRNIQLTYNGGQFQSGMVDPYSSGITLNLYSGQNCQGSVFQDTRGPGCYIFSGQAGICKYVAVDFRYVDD